MRPVTADQIIWIIHLEKDNISEIAESETRKGDDKFRKSLIKNFPHLFHRVYILNVPKFYMIIFKAISLFMSKKSVEEVKLLSYDYHAKLDKKIGLRRLPKCVGGTNPESLENYTNFFDKHFEASFLMKKIGIN